MTTARHQTITARASSDTLVLDYLANLWAVTEGLAPELRDELMGAVADFIAVRRTDTADDEEAERILQLLGPPEVLADSARGGRRPLPMLLRPSLGGPPSPDSTQPTRTWVTPPPEPPPYQLVEQAPSAVPGYAGLTLLIVGSMVLPIVGSLLGITLTSCTRLWTSTQRTVAASLLFGSMFVGGVLSAMLAVGDGDAAFVAFWLATGAGAWAAALSLIPGLADHRRRTREVHTVCCHADHTAQHHYAVPQPTAHHHHNVYR
jgi:hypothetical protein